MLFWETRLILDYIVESRFKNHLQQKSMETTPVGVRFFRCLKKRIYKQLQMLRHLK